MLRYGLIEKQGWEDLPGRQTLVTRLRNSLYDNPFIQALQRIQDFSAASRTDIFKFVVASQYADTASEASSPLVSVEHLGVNIAAESIQTETGFIAGDVKQSLSSSKLGSDPVFEDAFLLRSQTEVTLTFLAMEDFSAQNAPLPDKTLARHDLKKDEVYLFKHQIPKDMPNLIVCAQGGGMRRYWIPRFSDVDGSLMLDPGFASFNKNRDGKDAGHILN
jgi:hypothetical protein